MSGVTIANDSVHTLVLHAFVDGVRIGVIAFRGGPAALWNVVWLEGSDTGVQVGVAIFESAFNAVAAVIVGLTAVGEARVWSVSTAVIDASVDVTRVSIVAHTVALAATSDGCIHTTAINASILGARISVCTVCCGIATARDVHANTLIFCQVTRVFGAIVVISEARVLPGVVAVLGIWGMNTLVQVAVV